MPQLARSLLDQVKELFGITTSDEGRPITDFAHQLEYDDLVRDARAVIAASTGVRRELRSRKRRSYDLRMRPYRTGGSFFSPVTPPELTQQQMGPAQQQLPRQATNRTPVEATRAGSRARRCSAEACC